MPGFQTKSASTAAVTAIALVLGIGAGCESYPITTAAGIGAATAADGDVAVGANTAFSDADTNQIGGPATATGTSPATQPARLDIRAAGESSIRVTLKPVRFEDDFPETPAVAPRVYPDPAISVRSLRGVVRERIGDLNVEVRPDPLTVVVTTMDGRPVQELIFEANGTLTFATGGQPILGMGEGGPQPGRNWRQQPVEFDRRGRLHEMRPRWQANMYGSRNPSAMLVGTSGWGLYVPTPWVRVDLTDPDRGAFIPWQPPPEAYDGPQTRRDQGEDMSKGRPPVDGIVPGLYDLFVFDGHEPAVLVKDFSTITGPAVMPPKWTLGYMQSHRTLEDDGQLIGIVDTFREKRIPVDAVIYLGTGFAPRGWNAPQPSFEFNPEVFDRDPRDVLADIHERNVHVVVHMVPYDRDELPTLRGTIPPQAGETLDASHIQTYWQEHVPLIEAGVDAFWPDEGDWFNLFERIKRHQMYYQGHLSVKPDVRPWSLQRNGHPGIAQWGGWVWSGDTDSAWKTLEAQIAVGLNYGLSIGPYWGSDIGGFYANNDLTGEMYARWFQFGAFSPSFRSHGRTWWTRLPWGWGLSEMGPQEVNNTNTVRTDGDRARLVLESNLDNPAIEPVARRYAELRYQLLPYTYTLAWQARSDGLPLMRALWLHYPEVERVRDMHTEYLWGRDLLIAPVFEEGATTRDVYLPAGDDWYDWWTNERHSGGQTVTRAIDLATMPIYARAGAIIPFDAVRQYTSQPVTEPTTLRVYAGANGEFTLYEDDGTSQAYLDGTGSWIRFVWDDGARTLTLEPSAPDGADNLVEERTFDVLLLPQGLRTAVTYTGATRTVSFR